MGNSKATVLSVLLTHRNAETCAEEFDCIVNAVSARTVPKVPQGSVAAAVDTQPGFAASSVQENW
jgi:hypothetical protein